MATANPAHERPATARPGIGPPPLPREHGAWVILFGPMIAAFAVGASFPLAPALLLVLAVTGGYLARHAASLLMRRRARDATDLWLALYGAAFLAGGLPLVVLYGRVDLLWVELAVALCFGVHSALAALPTRKRLDRSQWGELLGTIALTSTAPAAHITAGGRLDSTALCLWAASLLFYASGIFHVRMLLGAAKIRRELSASDRWLAGRDSLIYHVLLAVLVAGLSVRIGGLAGLLTWLAYLPVLWRAFMGYATLSSRLPPLKRIGLVETGYALWFTVLFVAAVRLG